MGFLCVITDYVRRLSVAAYGQCLIWDIPAVAPKQPSPSPVDTASILPLARIKETLGTGIVREEVVFDAENNALLVVLNERKIK